jgi:hypothetical protein
MIAGLDPDDVREAARRMLGKPATWANPFGDGTAAARILDALEPALAAAHETEPTPTTSVGSETDPTDDADVLDRDAESDAHTHTTTRPSVRGS